MRNTWRQKVLFLLALASRSAMMPMLGHWCAILGMALIGAPLEWAADYTFIGTVALGLGSILVVTALNQDGRISERMSLGPDKLLRYSALVLGAAMASSLGGLLLLFRDAGPAAWWAMGLGTFVAVCETSALMGSIYLGALEAQSRA